MQHSQRSWFALEFHLLMIFAPLETRQSPPAAGAMIRSNGEPFTFFKGK